MCERSAHELNAPSHVARYAFANACATLPSLARAVTNPAKNKCDWRSRGRARSVVDRACDRQLSCALQRAFASRASLQQSGQLTSVLCRDAASDVGSTRHNQSRDEPSQSRSLDGSNLVTLDVKPEPISAHRWGVLPLTLEAEALGKPKAPRSVLGG
jgi:hypothetical protein